MGTDSEERVVLGVLVVRLETHVGEQDWLSTIVSGERPLIRSVKSRDWPEGRKVGDGERRIPTNEGTSGVLLENMALVSRGGGLRFSFFAGLSDCEFITWSDVWSGGFEERGQGCCF